MIVNKRS